jgi:hypothetical protein
VVIQECLAKPLEYFQGSWAGLASRILNLSVFTLNFKSVPYCLSQTTRLLKDWPLGSAPLAVMVRTFPSLETANLAVSTCLPPLLKFTSTVLASIRLAAMVSAPLGTAPVVG